MRIATSCTGIRFEQWERRSRYKRGGVKDSRFLIGPLNKFQEEQTNVFELQE